MALLSLLHQLWPLILLLPPFLLMLFKLSTGTGKQNLPPSPSKLPIIGNLHQLGKLPHRSLHTLSAKYGPLMFLKLGQSPLLVVSSAEMAKEIMKKHDIVFSNRPKTTAANVLVYQCQDLGFSPYGEYWRQVRKICVLELLSPKRVHSFQYVREEEIEVMISKIRRACLDKIPVNLSEMLVGVSNNIVSRCVLGKKYEENGRSKFGELSRKATVQMMIFSIGDMFPSLGFMDVLSGLISRLKETKREFDTFLNQVIEEHKNMNFDRNDFIHILLQLRETDRLDIELSNVNIKAILLDMFVAGTDTTSTLMEWMMAELLKNPEKMKKVQEEVRRIVGKNSKIEETNIHKMEYFKCVMKETLRLHPPVPLSVPRETSENVELGGYNIPKKTRVFVNIWAIQRDPKVWDNPEEFVPERFENNPVDFRGQDFEFIPFGGGRRGCPGLGFGVASAEFVMANLLYWFNWELFGENLDMGEGFGLVVYKKIPLHLVPQPYTP